METTNVKKPISRRVNPSTSLINVSRVQSAHSMFANLTLAQVGEKYNLSDDDVDWGFATNRNGDQVKVLILTIEGKDYQIGFSRGMRDEDFEPNTLLNCVFYERKPSVKNPDGTQKTVDGKIVIDEDAPTVMSLGKPSGLVIERRERVFTEPAPGDDVDETSA